MNKGFSATSAKLLAIAAMAINHLGIIFRAYLPQPVYTFCFFAGGFTFPIMAYMASEGYRYTLDIRRYLTRLLVFSIASILPFWLCFHTWTLDVIFTILFGVLALYCTEKVKNRALHLPILLFFAILSNYCDWPIMGVLLIYGMNQFKNDNARAIIPILILVAVNEGYCAYEWFSAGIYQFYTVPYMLGCLVAVPVLVSYNIEHRKGAGLKYAFYIFYPCHLLLIYFAHNLLTTLS